MALAISKLTTIAESLAKQKPWRLCWRARPQTPLDRAPELAATAAMALKVLHTVKERPKELAEGILACMADDFGLARSIPGAVKVPVTARGWVESCARIQSYLCVDSEWHRRLAGRLLARALLGLAAIEQVSLDRGSWTLILLEEPALQHSFVGRQLVTRSERPFTKLLGA